MRKKHLDEKIQIQANRLKQQTEEKLRRAKSNHVKRRFDKEKLAKERHDVSLKKYHRRCNKAIVLKKKRHTEIIKRNEALDAHKHYKLDLRKKKETKKEMIKYRKVKHKYKKIWHEDLPLPNPPQEPLSLFKMVQRSPKTNYARSPSKNYGSNQVSLTRPASSYVPTTIRHKTRNSEEVKRRASEARDKLQRERHRINLERLQKQRTLFKKRSIKLEKEEEKRKELLEVREEKKAQHMTNQAAKQAEKLQLAMYQQRIKMEKAKRLRKLLAEKLKEENQEKKEKAILAELKGHYLKDKYDCELEQICKAQADLIRHRTELAKQRKLEMEQEQENSNSMAASENLMYRQQQIEALLERKAHYLAEIQKKNEETIREHERRFHEIQHQKELQEKLKSERLKQKTEATEERIKKLYHARKIRTQSHMNNTHYKRQYVMDDFAIPLNVQLVEVGPEEKEANLSPSSDARISATPKVNRERASVGEPLYLTPAQDLSTTS